MVRPDVFARAWCEAITKIDTCWMTPLPVCTPGTASGNSQLARCPQGRSLHPGAVNEQIQFADDGFSAPGFQDDRGFQCVSPAGEKSIMGCFHWLGEAIPEIAGAPIHPGRRPGSRKCRLPSARHPELAIAQNLLFGAPIQSRKGVYAPQYILDIFYE